MRGFGRGTKITTVHWFELGNVKGGVNLERGGEFSTDCRWTDYLGDLERNQGNEVSASDTQSSPEWSWMTTRLIALPDIGGQEPCVYRPPPCF